MKRTLQQRYEAICKEYIRLFCDKQGLSFSYWLGTVIGGAVVFSGDYCFNFGDIVYDIDTDQPGGLIMNWMDDGIENDKKSLNYYAYSKGLRYSDI